MGSSYSAGRLLGAGFLLAGLVGMPAMAELDLDRNPPTGVGDCEALVRSHPRDYHAWRCFELIARRQQLWSASIRALEAHLATDGDNPYALLNLGWIEADRSRGRAVELLLAAAERFAALDEAEGEILARTTLAYFLRAQGRHEESAKQIARADEVAEASGDRKLRAVVRIQKGWAAYVRGDYTAAINHFQGIAVELPPAEAGRLGGPIHRGLGTAAWSAGRLEEALQHYRDAAEHYRRSGDRYAEAEERYSVALVAGRLYWRTPEGLKQIRGLIDEAVSVARAGGNRGAEAAARLLRAQDPGVDLATRIGETEKVIELLRESGKPAQRCFALRLLANQLANLDFAANLDRIFALVDEAIRTARSIGSLQDEARAWVIRAGLRDNGREREEVVADYLAAIEAVEKLRDLQLDQLVRARFLWDWAFVYYRACGFLLEPLDQLPSEHDKVLAFEIMERLRARILLDAMDSASATAAASGEGKPQRERDALLGRIAAVQRSLLAPGMSEAELEATLEELRRLEVAEADLRERIGRADPRYGRLRRPKLPAVRELQETLAPDQALFAFQLSTREVSESKWNWNGGSWVLVLTRDDFRAVPLADRDEIEERVAVFLGLLERRDELERDAAARLYDDLLADAIATLPDEVRRLVIVPDGVLHRLPFGALRRTVDADPLAARFELGSAPSAAFWYRWRRSPPPDAPRAALALADPRLPSADGPAAADHPSSFARNGLGPLPHARSEASTLVGQLGGRSRLLSGTEASEHFLKRADLRRFGVIHLAAHAVVDDRQPQRSAVLLAPGDAEEDGLLQMREVVALDLDGPLVILSACSSVSGELTGGEGVVGLARAFFQAGARSVVGGLWPLRDDEAAGMIRDLARHLGRGSSVGAALAAVRRERIAAGEPTAAWAGLVILGDGDWVPLPGGRRPPYRGAIWAGAILLILGVLGAAALHLRRAAT